MTTCVLSIPITTGTARMASAIIAMTAFGPTFNLTATSSLEGAQLFIPAILYHGFSGSGMVLARFRARASYERDFEGRALASAPRSPQRHESATSRLMEIGLWL